MLLFNYLQVACSFSGGWWWIQLVYRIDLRRTETVASWHISASLPGADRQFRVPISDEKPQLLCRLAERPRR